MNDIHQRIDDLIQSYREDMIGTLCKWVHIPSLKSDPLPNAPFGKENRRMLDTVLEDSRAMGFDVLDADGYAMHADLGSGDEKDALAILAHLDVVPPADGWIRDPFGAQRIDGKIYGRGTNDDKGPAVAALYAMRAVREAGIPLKRRVRLILGCDEETGSSDMAYYKAHYTMPRSGFSPDANYPVINIEKGHTALCLNGTLAGDGLQIINMHVGERANIIPGSAAVLIQGDQDTAARAAKAANQLGFPLETEQTEQGILLRTTGITGHAALPESARNAIGQMLLILRETGAQGIIRELADKIGITYDGKGIGIAMEDAVSGPLTACLDIIDIKNGQLSALMDVRYPVLMDPQMMLKVAQMHFTNGVFTMPHVSEPHYVSEESQLVQCLLDVYHEVTGFEKKAIAIGGGTYARELEEGVAFGAVFPDEEELAHQANEYITEDDLMINARIFAYAIIKLCS